MPSTAWQFFKLTPFYCLGKSDLFIGTNKSLNHRTPCTSCYLISDNRVLSEKFFNRVMSGNPDTLTVLCVVMHLPKHMFERILWSLEVRCTEGPTVLQTACPDVVLILQGIEIERCWQPSVCPTSLQSMVGCLPPLHTIHYFLVLKVYTSRIENIFANHNIKQKMNLLYL